MILTAFQKNYNANICILKLKKNYYLTAVRFARTCWSYRKQHNFIVLEFIKCMFGIRVVKIGNECKLPKLVFAVF